MKIVALDDERLALEVLTDGIKECCPNDEIYSFQLPNELIAWIDKGNACDIAFLDIEMQETNGIEVAKQIKQRLPKTNIIFSTGYEEYRKDAFKLHASGYLTKPILPEDIKEELGNLRYVNYPNQDTGLKIKAFGNFEVFYNGVALAMKPKSKEALAYLIDRSGSFVSNAELYSVLFEDEPGHEENLKKIKKSLIDSLDSIKCRDILTVKRGELCVNKNKVACDLYDFEKGVPYAINSYVGEYMEQYSWAEFSKGRFTKAV